MVVICHGRECFPSFFLRSKPLVLSQASLDLLLGLLRCAGHSGRRLPVDPE